MPISTMPGRVGVTRSIQDAETFLLFILENLENAAVHETTSLLPPTPFHP